MQPCASQSAQPTNRSIYADISGKCRGLPPVTVVDPGSVVDPVHSSPTYQV